MVDSKNGLPAEAERYLSKTQFVESDSPEVQDFVAVSYTHLTLPTICSV